MSDQAGAFKSYGRENWGSILTAKLGRSESRPGSPKYWGNRRDRSSDSSGIPFPTSVNGERWRSEQQLQEQPEPKPESKSLFGRWRSNINGSLSSEKVHSNRQGNAPPGAPIIINVEPAANGGENRVIKTLRPSGSWGNGSRRDDVSSRFTGIVPDPTRRAHRRTQSTMPSVE